MINENISKDSIRILGVTIHAKNGLYSLTDLFKASGAKSSDRPKNWLATKDCKKEIEFLVNAVKINRTLFEMGRKNSIAQGGGILPFLSEQQLISENVISIAIGSSEFEGGTYVCEDLVYSYAMWVSPEFKFAVIRAFKAMINNDLKEMQQQIQVAVNTEIKRREPNDVGTLAYLVGCSTYQSQYYYDVLVGKGLLTKKTYECGQSKYFAVGSVDWFEGYKRSTMLFNSKILAHLPEQIELL